jgi:hypothetical protein
MEPAYPGHDLLRAYELARLALLLDVKRRVCCCGYP